MDRVGERPRATRADLQGPLGRRAGWRTQGAQGYRGTLAEEGARVRAPVHCVRVERVFSALCALPLADSVSCSGSRFYKNHVGKTAV